MEVNWNVVGIVAGVAVYVPMVAWALRKPLKAAWNQIMALSRMLQAVLAVMVVVATVEAQKSGNGGGGDGGDGGTNGMMMAGAPLGSWVGPGVALPGGLGLVEWPNTVRPSNLRSAGTGEPEATVTPEEIAQGYRLVAETNDTEYTFAMPTNAVYIGRLHQHGARSDFGKHIVDLGSIGGEATGWAFPCGTNNATAATFWWFMDGRLQDALCGPTFAASAGLGDVLAMQGESRLWAAAGAETRTVTWERFFAGGDTNLPVNAQIVLYADGGFVTRSNDLVRVYSRVDPNDWDGDGLDNTIDEHPDAHGGDMHGTGVDWLNAECSAVLSASVDSNDVLHVVWNTNSNENAYYWLSFTAQRDGTRIVVDCESESNLGDMVVIANSNQVCSVPLLMGPSYHVSASWPVADISASDPEAEVWLNAVQPSGLNLRGGSGGGESAEFGVQRQVGLGFEGTAPNLGLTCNPSVGASLSSFTGGCCQAELDGTYLYWECSSGCGCGGFSHDDVCATATWEGYSQAFWISQSCQCQEYRKEHPETWFGMSASSVVMLHGEMGSVSACYEPNETPSGTVTLSCTSGSGKIALWENTNRTQSVSLPMTWDASSASGMSFYVEGVEVSDSVGDVEFEYELALAGEAPITITRQMTVATVKQMNVTSTKSGSSGNSPPFMNGEEYEFSVTNSLSPDKHLVVPFHKVATQDGGGFSVADLTVDMELVLEPEGVSSAGLSVNWCVDSALPAMSGSLVNSGGATAHFVNPKQGGVYRFRAEVAGSSNTYANVVLPLCGAEVSGVFEGDVALVQGVLANILTRYDEEERQKPMFGLKWFVGNGAGDYRGRVDSTAARTVWQYNQVADDSGLGAVATWYGVPTRMAKLGNLIVGLGAETLGVESSLQEQAQQIGTLNDATATASWNAGVGLASGGSVSDACFALATNMWASADSKVRNLWPNTAGTDNHVTTTNRVDYNYFFRSPGIIQRGQREFGQQ